MRFYIMTDMEGVSGIVDFDSYCELNGRYYEKARRLTTLEVNAAVEGVLSTGRHEVVVFDGHGDGGIDIELLHKDATVIIGRPVDLMMDFGNGHFDAQMMIGQHAMKNAPGANLHHTYDHVNIVSLHINGIEIGEIGVNALRAGMFNTPTIFLSGDRAACSEIEKLIPGVHTCAVKRGLTETCAECLSPEAAREAIKLGARKAAEDFSQIKPYKLSGPYEAVYKFTNAASLAGFTDKSYCSIGPGNTVNIHADTIEELLEKRLWGL